MKTKEVVLIFLISLGFFSLSSTAQNMDDEDLRVKRIKEQLTKFYNDFSQEKVFLHLDKKEYTVGQSIWYKAYLVNGTTHIPEAKSFNLYIEIANSDREVVNMQRLKVIDGYAEGDLPLNDTIPEGFYHIRAYTAWMTNFDPELIPSYSIYIKNPKNQDFMSKEQLRYNKRQNKAYTKAETQKNIEFFPEGGVFINDLENSIGFKASNGLGLGLDIKGSIFDENNNKITDFKSLYKGIGKFSFTPENKKKYFAIFEGNDKKYELPERVDKGSLIKITEDDNNFIIEILSNKELSADRNANEVILFAHSRGDIKFSKIIALEDVPTKIKINKSQFSAGISHITLFNGRALPIAERLVFKYPGENINFTIEMNMSESFYNTATFDVLAQDDAGKPVQSFFSVAVTPEFKKGTTDLSANIKTTLLFSSDIRGAIEDPGFYFSGHPNAPQALDNLLLTQGWRRFNWNNLMAGEFPEIKNQRETGISVAGKITREFFDIPFANSRIELTVLNSYNDIYTTYSDEKGKFQFDNLNYPDTIAIEIYAFKPSGKRNLVIKIDEGELPNVELNKEKYERYAEGKGKFEYQLHSNENYKSPSEILEEEFKEAGHHKIHGEPDYVITSDQIPSGYNNIFQVLDGRVPGVNVNGNSINIRGPSSILLSNEPLYIIDGVPSDASGAYVINPEDVDRIEILSGPSSSIYGSRGANGVIAIYTKKGRYMKKGFLEFEMLGYYTARDFYKPKYNEFTSFEEFKNYNPTIYWAPFMETNKMGMTKLKFEVPDYEFPIKIDIQGITENGIPASGGKTITLR